MAFFANDDQNFEKSDSMKKKTPKSLFVPCNHFCVPNNLKKNMFSLVIHTNDSLKLQVKFAVLLKPKRIFFKCETNT